MRECRTTCRTVPDAPASKDAPEEHRGDLDLMVAFLDREKDTGSGFCQARFMPLMAAEGQRTAGLSRAWFTARDKCADRDDSSALS
jgi:hypothetical protein